MAVTFFIPYFVVILSFLSVKFHGNHKSVTMLRLIWLSSVLGISLDLSGAISHDVVIYGML